MTRRQPPRKRLAALVLAPAATGLAALLLLIAAFPAAALGSAPTASPIGAATSAPASPSASPSAGPTPTRTPTPKPSKTKTPKPVKTKRPPRVRTVRPHPHKVPATPKRPHPKRKPWPVGVVLRTIPALAGVRFSVDGAVYTTGPDGTVVITREHDFAQHTLALLTPQLVLSGRHYGFARWSGQRDPDQTYRTVVTGLPWRAGYAVTAAFTEQCPVTPAFTDQHGVRIEPALLASATLKSDTGQLTPLAVHGTTWLACTTTAYGNGTLTTRPVGYRLQSLYASGTNIVDSGRQAFVPAKVRAPVFVGYFYDLTVTAHDALFGGSSGATALVLGPDGTSYRRPFGSAHAAVFKHLPRGDYTVSVTGGGLGLSKTVRLSRDTGTDLQMVSAGDVGTGAGGGAAVALALPLLSRHRRSWLWRLLRRAEAMPE
jgi:hypothetical protein